MSFFDIEVEAQQRMQADDDLGPSEEEMLQWMEEEPVRAPKRRRRLAVSPRGPFNPVALLMKLPRDLRDFVKTFWTYTRFPLYVAITERPWAGATHARRFKIAGTGNQFNVHRDDGTFSGDAELVSEAIADTYAATLFCNGFDRLVTRHTLSIHSECCAKHRRPCVFRYDHAAGEFLWGFEQDRLARKNALGTTPSIQDCVYLVRGMIECWSPCVDDM